MSKRPSGVTLKALKQEKGMILILLQSFTPYPFNITLIILRLYSTEDLPMTKLINLILLFKIIQWLSKSIQKIPMLSTTEVYLMIGNVIINQRSIISRLLQNWIQVKPTFIIIEVLPIGSRKISVKLFWIILLRFKLIILILKPSLTEHFVMIRLVITLEQIKITKVP